MKFFKILRGVAHKLRGGERFDRFKIFFGGTGLGKKG